MAPKSTASVVAQPAHSTRSRMRRAVAVGVTRGGLILRRDPRVFFEADLLASRKLVTDFSDIHGSVGRFAAGPNILMVGGLQSPSATRNWVVVNL